MVAIAKGLNKKFIFQPPSIKDFAIIKPISRGAFGKVFLGYKIADAKNLFAIKVSSIEKLIFGKEKNYNQIIIFFFKKGYAKIGYD